MELTIDDVRQLALELWLAQRENAQLREANQLLRQANADLAQRAEGDRRADSHPEGH